jgi:fatty acid desaturase
LEEPGSTTKTIRRVTRLFLWLAIVAYAGIGNFCLVSASKFAQPSLAYLLGTACLGMAFFRWIRMKNKNENA